MANPNAVHLRLVREYLLIVESEPLTHPSPLPACGERAGVGEGSYDGPVINNRWYTLTEQYFGWALPAQIDY